MHPGASPRGRPVTMDGTARDVDSPVAIGNMRIAPAANDPVGPSHDKEAGRPGEKMGIPVAASDDATLAIGVRLVNDLGFDAVPVGGGLHGSAKFELRGPAAGVKTAAELKTIMG